MKRHSYYYLLLVVLILYGSYAFLSKRIHNKSYFIKNLVHGCVSFSSPDQELSIIREDGLKTVASLYIPKQDGKGLEWY